MGKEFPFDPRVTPARLDLAARHLQGRVDAKRFVEGELREVIEPQAALRQAPSHEAPQLTEALKGERATVYETTDEGWSWAQLESDGYVGWLSANALRAPGPPATHRVTALRTLVFPGPSIKLAPIEALSLGCRVAIARSELPFAVTADGGFLPAQHLAPLGAQESDMVAVAEKFLGTPYLWGGKTSLGLDCSGLVQVAMNACGLSCPRDSDMQEATLGRAIPPSTALAEPKRGDLLFWKGHVAIVRDRTTLLHANVFHMAVAIEPIAAAIARIRAAGSEITGVKRIG